MHVSRRDFLKYCCASSGVLALGALDLGGLSRALADPNGPTVLWLQGAACTGCSVSFLNRIAPEAPTTAADVLINTVNLAYHPNLMAVAGDTAVGVLKTAMKRGNYILVIEGGVPTAFDGATCFAWTERGKDVTFLEAVKRLSSRAAQVVCVGTCASYGGIPAAPPNPTGVKSVQAVLRRPTINLPGCPPHPDWIVGAIALLLSGDVPALDAHGRPTLLYGQTVHELCPRYGSAWATEPGMDNSCLGGLGCYGPVTTAGCPSSLWNGGTNFCVEANAHCIGCVEPAFPRGTLRAHAPFIDQSGACVACTGDDPRPRPPRDSGRARDDREDED